jgi:hypothetical protein
LSVPEGGVGDEHIFRGIDRHDLMVEIDPANLVIGEDVLLEIRLHDILEIELPELRMLVIQNLLVLVPFCHGFRSPSSRDLSCEIGIKKGHRNDRALAAHDAGSLYPDVRTTQGGGACGVILRSASPYAKVTFMSRVSMKIWIIMLLGPRNLIRTAPGFGDLRHGDWFCQSEYSG